MEQLIKITTIPIEYEFKINDAKLERRRGTAELAITRDEGGMKIRSKPIKLSVDSFDARNSVVPTTRTSIEQSAVKGQQTAYEATAQFAKEGRMLLKAKIGEGGEVLNSIFQDRIAKSTGRFGIDFIPQVGPELNWEMPELSIQYEMDKLNFDAKINNGNIEFVPGSIELLITQHPDIHVEYIGEPIYVPPRAAEFFGGKILDTEA